MYAKPTVCQVSADVETASCTPVPPPACEQDSGGWVRHSDDLYVGWRHSYVGAADLCLENPQDTEPQVPDSPVHVYGLLVVHDPTVLALIEWMMRAESCVQNHYLLEPGLGIMECMPPPLA